MNHPAQPAPEGALSDPVYVPSAADSDVKILISGTGTHHERRAALAACMARDRFARKQWMDKYKAASAESAALLDRREKQLDIDALHQQLHITEEQVAALRTLVAKQKDALLAIYDPRTKGWGLNPDNARIVEQALALIPSAIADELAAKDARIRELEGHHQRDEELLVQRTAVLTAAQSALREAEAARGEAEKDSGLLNAFEAIRSDDVQTRQISEDEIEPELLGHYWTTISVQSTSVREAIQATVDAARAQEARP